MTRIILFISFWPLLFSLGANCKDQVKVKRQNLYRVVVDSLQVVRIEPKKGEAELVIYGILPNPSYEIDHVQVVKKGGEVKVIPWARHDPTKIVIQVTVPFKEKCRIKGLSRREYQIKVQGANRALVKKLRLPKQ